MATFAYACLALALAWTVVSSPVSVGLDIARSGSRELTQEPLHKTAKDILADDAPFTGLSTFANLPYVHCLSQDPNIENYDIAVLGAPFDTVR